MTDAPMINGNFLHLEKIQTIIRCTERLLYVISLATEIHSDRFIQITHIF